MLLPLPNPLMLVAAVKLSFAGPRGAGAPEEIQDNDARPTDSEGFTTRIAYTAPATALKLTILGSQDRSAKETTQFPVLLPRGDNVLWPLTANTDKVEGYAKVTLVGLTNLPLVNVTMPLPGATQRNQVSPLEPASELLLPEKPEIWIAVAKLSCDETPENHDKTISLLKLPLLSTAI